MVRVRASQEETGLPLPGKKMTAAWLSACPAARKEAHLAAGDMHTKPQDTEKGLSDLELLYLVTGESAQKLAAKFNCIWHAVRSD